MSTTAHFTADELLNLPTGMGKRYELVEGELRIMSPSGWRHGEIVDNLHALLSAFIRDHELGRGFGAETGFLLSRNPDTVRAPDFAFIAKENLPERKPSEAYWPGVPDLAVEVVSPGDRKSEVEGKVAAWLDAGCPAVWVVDPKTESITAHFGSTESRTAIAGEMFHGDPILTGFSCAVAELFR
jgi:Uma2 family endonuclease